MGSEPPVLLGDVVAGKYKVTRFLGAGGMGVVVAAEHLELGQLVALKFLHASAVANAGAAERFLREARAAVRIRSEHVARVLDVGRDAAGTPFMVMEHLEGRDLGQVIQEEAPLEITRAIGYILQACEAIAVAHAIGIVHRDLKPSNIFVTSRADGTPLVKVLDFGISKAIEAGAPLSLTSTGEILGSPIYMSPEQLRNTRSVDRRTDIWSLGSVLYELLTKHHPFEAESMPTLCAMIAADEPKTIGAFRSDVADELEGVVMRCLEKQPQGRFGSVADFARALVPFAAPDGLTVVGRIARIAAGNEATAASAIATPKLLPSVPAPHEATAASPVALPGKRASLPVQKRRLAFAAGALLGAIALVVIRIARLYPAAAVERETRPLSSVDLPAPPASATPLLVASGLGAHAALLPVDVSVEARPSVGTEAGASPPSAPPAAAAAKSRASSPAAPAVPSHAAEKEPLDPLIDQR